MLTSDCHWETVGEYDVLVCGGGPAGFCAAIQAGYLGCRTAVIERYGMLGGAMTLGGITVPASFHAYDRQVIAGIGWDLMKRLQAMGWAEMPDFSKPRKNPVSWVQINAMMAAYVMDMMCEEAGVDLFFHQPVVDVLKLQEDGMERLDGVVIATKEGLKAVKARVVIDCTGDGDVAAWAGAAFEKGDPVTGELQPGTLSFYLAGYRPDETCARQIDEAYTQARKNGRLQRGDYWAEQFSGGSVILKDQGRNINHVSVDGADSTSRSEAEIAGRASVARIINWIREDLPGGKFITPIPCSPEVWVRESRRIIGETYITGRDYISCREYLDGICYSFYPIDIHKGNGDIALEMESGFLNRDKVPVIPLGAMVVKGFANLLTAGRCVSCDRVAQSALRVQASCMAMGQAAGALAALAGINGGKVREVSLTTLKETLEKFGAIVP